MSALATALLAELDENTLDRLAELLAPRLATRLGDTASASPWLNSAEAADYLRCDRRRIFDLVQLQELKPVRDGRRLLFRRSDLDSYLEASR